jgi:hypothetical protein
MTSRSKQAETALRWCEMCPSERAKSLAAIMAQYPDGHPQRVKIQQQIDEYHIRQKAKSSAK